MIKKGLGILLAMVIVAQSLMNLGLYAYYNLNKKMIIAKLCVNKNNPQMHCNGHCYLSKQLQKAEQNEKQSALVIKEQEEIISNSTEESSLQYFPSFTSSAFPPYNSILYQSDNSNSLIKPPAA